MAINILGDSFSPQWRLCELSDISEITMGQSPSSSTYNYEGIGLPFFQGKAEFSDIHPIVEKWCNQPNKIAEPDDILLSVRAPVGSVNIADQTCCIGRGLAAIKYHQCNKWVYYYFKLIEKKLDEHGTGTTFRAISREITRSLVIPIPPLPEQRRIVAKIEELFSELGKGVELLKTLQQQLKVYRQSVLKSAFEGKLTEEWRKGYSSLNDNHSIKPPLVNKAKAIAVIPDIQLPSGWVWVVSGDLFDFVTSGSRGWAKYYSDSGAIFIRITNLDFDSLELDLNGNIQYVTPPSGSEGIRTRVMEGDFLFSITGYLGMFAIAPTLEEAYVNQHIALCRPIPGFNKKYLGYWIISKSGGYHYLNLLQKGATKAGLGLDDIRSFPVPICSLEEQQLIVQEIECRLSVADKLDEIIEQTLQQAIALRQSILKKAFEGRLLSEAELDEVRREPDWEPASVLLERIKAQKAAIDQPKKTVKKGKKQV